MLSDIPFTGLTIRGSNHSGPDVRYIGETARHGPGQGIHSVAGESPAGVGMESDAATLGLVLEMHAAIVGLILT